MRRHAAGSSAGLGPCLGPCVTLGLGEGAGVEQAAWESAGAAVGQGGAHRDPEAADGSNEGLQLSLA